MNGVPEKDKKIMNELFLLQDALQEFTNPISKSTFQALPRIYGKRKKKKYIVDYPFTTKASQQQKIMPFRAERAPIINQKEEQKFQTARQKQMDDRATNLRYKTQIKRHSKQAVEKMSKPRQQFCGKRYCFCNKQHKKALMQSDSKSSLKPKHIRGLSVKLPELNRSDEPDDVESKHKVTMHKKFLNDRDGNSRPYTLLDLLRNNQKNSPSRVENSLEKKQQGEQQKLKSKNNNYNVSVQTQFDDYEQENNEERMQTLPNELNLNSQRKNKKKQLGIQTKNVQRQQQDEKDSNRNKQAASQIRNSQSQSAQFNNNNDSESPRQNFLRLKEAYKDNRSQPSSDNQDSRSIASSISSVTISKHIFDKIKNPNTVFHKLNTQQTKSNIKRSRVKSEKLNSQDLTNNKPKEKYKFQKKNGLFVIPEQQEYVNYLKDYEPMSHNTKIKDLIQKQSFKVIKSSQGVYFGQMENDEKHGKGIMVTQKNIFEGKYERDVKKTGSEKNIDGIYKGQFLNGKRQGFGSFQWYNGQTFEGQWENGTKNGWGVWKSPKGDFYEGQWKLNRQHGKGTYKHRLSTYRGYFIDFLKDGKGQQIFSNGDKYLGTYKQGKPHGKGKYQWADGSYYEGDFVKGVREGKGVWKFKNGTVYEGQFKNDFKNGTGKESYKTGQIFEGTFHEGDKLEGVLVDANGNSVFIKNQV